MKSHVGGLPPPAGVVLAGLAIVLAALLPDLVRSGALAQSVPYQEPLVIRSGPDHVLDAAFVARQDSAQIAGQTVGGAWNYHVVGADGVEDRRTTRDPRCWSTRATRSACASSTGYPSPPAL